MGEVFLKVLNMSATAGWLILAVLFIRCLLRKAPKWLMCLLWGVVAVKLIFPFSIESSFSLIPAAEPVRIITHTGSPGIQEDATDHPQVSNEFVGTPYEEGVRVDTKEQGIDRSSAFALLWIMGVLGFLVYAMISYIKLKKQVAASLTVRKGVKECDEIAFPFILGVLLPTIYIPSSLDAASRSFVISHETAHLKRRDHWWKPLGYLILCIHWFNPLCWISYILLCRDIEMACDEKVIRDMGKEEKVGYSQTLLDLGHAGRMLTACPVAFGEVGVKERVKGVLNYRKPAFWIVFLSVVACVVISVCFFTSPKKSFERESVVGRYICRGEGWNEAVLEINRCGSYTFSPDLLSGYLGSGYWRLEKDTLILKDSGAGRGKLVTMVFSFDGENLNYLAKKSDPDSWPGKENARFVPFSAEETPGDDPYLYGPEIVPFRNKSLGDLDRNGTGE